MVERSNFTVIQGNSECQRIRPYQRLISTGYRQDENGQQVQYTAVRVRVKCAQLQCDFYNGSTISLESSRGVQAAVETREKVDAGCWLNPKKKGLPRPMRTW